MLQKFGNALAILSVFLSLIGAKIHIKLEQKFVPLDFNRSAPTDNEQTHFFDDNLENHIPGRPMPMTNILTGNITIGSTYNLGDHSLYQPFETTVIFDTWLGFSWLADTSCAYCQTYDINMVNCSDI